jgi:pyruvate dehydrogenase E1 component alpha subunit
VIFFGDGAAETGVFHESLNFANVHRLPILFVCENNLYSVNTPMAPRQPVSRTIADLAIGHAIDAHRADGQTVEAVCELTARVLDRVRAGEGPALLELLTYRWAEHCGPNSDIHLGYRTKEELDAWGDRCPIKLHRALLEHERVLDADHEAAMRAELTAEIDQAVAFAKSSPFPQRSDLYQGIYA